MQRTFVTLNNNNIIYFMHFIFVVVQAYENINYKNFPIYGILFKPEIEIIL